MLNDLALKLIEKESLNGKEIDEIIIAHKPDYKTNEVEGEKDDSSDKSGEGIDIED